MSHRTYLIGDAYVTVGDSWVVTRFPDGSEVHAHPDPEDVERQSAIAASLGYPDVASMTRDHDAAHTLLSVVLGGPYSQTLHGVALGQYAPPERVKFEESLALLLQRVSQVGLAAVLEDYRLTEEVTS